MKISLKKDILTIKHKLKSSETYRFNKGKGYSTISIYKKPTSVKGISSYCEDGKHCLFIDYDNCPLWLVKQDFEALQGLYGLPQAFLFSTKQKKEDGEWFGNWHIICPVKLYPKEIYEILSKTHADVNFFSMPLRNKYRNWILRISQKAKRSRPTFISEIGKNTNLNKEVSSPHLKILKKLYPEIEHLNYKNQDHKTKIFWQEYETINY